MKLRRVVNLEEFEAVSSSYDSLSSFSSSADAEFVASVS